MDLSLIEGLIGSPALTFAQATVPFGKHENSSLLKNRVSTS